MHIALAADPQELHRFSSAAGVTPYHPLNSVALGVFDPYQIVYTSSTLTWV